MSGPKPDSSGVNVILMVKEHALADATAKESEADALETRAEQLRWEAKGLREMYAAGGPYFPNELKLMKEVGPSRTA